MSVAPLFKNPSKKHRRRVFIGCEPWWDNSRWRWFSGEGGRKFWFGFYWISHAGIDLIGRWFALSLLISIDIGGGWRSVVHNQTRQNEECNKINNNKMSIKDTILWIYTAFWAFLSTGFSKSNPTQSPFIPCFSTWVPWGDGGTTKHKQDDKELNWQRHTLTDSSSGSSRSQLTTWTLLSLEKCLFQSSNSGRRCSLLLLASRCPILIYDVVVCSP